MRANSIRRVAGGAAALMLAGATILSSASVVTAAPPRWSMEVTSLPAAVSPGAAAGYRVVVTNAGPSNISSLYLVSNRTQATAYIVSDRPGTCSPTGALSCAFGALNAGQSVGITVAYTTPATGSSFGVEFQANTTGSTFSDTKGRSHGDTLTGPGTTSLNSNRDFGGGFSTSSGSVIGNSAQLTGNNKQATAVKLPAGVEGTVSDGTTNAATCTNAPGISCNNLFGEWSVVRVAGGATQAAPFTILITYKTGTPKGFLHVRDNGFQEPVGPCPTGGYAGTPCFTWSGNQATIYTTYNGSWRGL